MRRHRGLRAAGITVVVIFGVVLVGRFAVRRLVSFYLDDHALHFDRISTTDGVKGAVLWKPDGRVELGR